MAKWLAWEEPRVVGDPLHVETFFARNLGSLIRARPGMPGRSNLDIRLEGSHRGRCRCLPKGHRRFGEPFFAFA